jgi:hypothetical protein
MKRIIKLPKAKIDEIFLSTTHENDALVNLYRASVPEFEKATKLFGFPTVSRNTAIYIIDKLKELSKKDGVQTNLLWLNKGFNSDENMKDWIVDLKDLKCEF